MRRRIQKELNDYNQLINEKKIQRIDIDITDISTIKNVNQRWSCRLKGLPNSPFENFFFFINVLFPLDYPFRTMKLEFLTQIFHPKISHPDDRGKIYFDALDDVDTSRGWSPCYTILKVMKMIRRNCLNNPKEIFVSGCINKKAYKLWKEKRWREYWKKAEYFCNKYAIEVVREYDSMFWGKFQYEYYIDLVILTVK